MKTPNASGTPLEDCDIEAGPSGLFVADWVDFIVLHFAVDAAVLAPDVPFELDRRDGEAWVSLVFFTLNRLRPLGTGPIGRWLFRPISDHPFLNVRTYVKGPRGDGICFLAEWVSNPLSARIGPATYRLPYRQGRFHVNTRPTAGITHVAISAGEREKAFELTAPSPAPGGEACPAGSLDAFLLERYRAYCFAGNAGREFVVAHEPWCARRLDWVRFELGFLRAEFPWFARAEYRLGHCCAGFHDVRMGWPHCVSLGADAAEPANTAPRRAAPCHV
jgi:uncharacterized protein YqjF (DUF2071 family)